MTKHIMTAALFALAMVAFIGASPAQATPYLTGDAASLSNGSSYSVGLGNDLGNGVRVQADVSRTREHGQDRNAVGLSAYNNFSDVSGFTPYLGGGVDYVTDSPHGSGGSVRVEAGVSHPVLANMSGDLYVRQTHDFISHNDDLTSVGVRLRLTL